MSLNNPEFKFDDLTHTYTLDGQVIPSATQIIKLCGLINDVYYTEASRLRGTAAHAGCHYLAEGDLDKNSLDPQIAGYVLAYEKVILVLEFKKLTEAEKPIYHPLYRYGTTPDHLWDEWDLTELKTGVMQPWTAIQTALQAMAKEPKNYLKFRRRGVELHKDGTYKIENFTDPNDFSVAIGMIAAANWILKYGGKNL